MPPLPKTNPVRRNAANAGRMVLPACGRKGRAPTVPVGMVLSAAATDIWRALWRTPQAVAWQELGCGRLVARYCQISAVNGVEPTDKAAVELRTMERDLGLSPTGLRALQWTIVDDKPAPVRQTSRNRRNLRAVDLSDIDLNSGEAG